MVLGLSLSKVRDARFGGSMFELHNYRHLIRRIWILKITSKAWRWLYEGAWEKLLDKNNPAEYSQHV